jgi:hypothetical protein
MSEKVPDTFWLAPLLGASGSPNSPHSPAVIAIFSGLIQHLLAAL